MGNLLMRNDLPDLIVQNKNIISHIDSQYSMGNSKIGILNDHHSQGLRRNSQLS